MTDSSNSDHSNKQQTQDGQSSALGRSYGLSGADADDSATGSAAGDASQNQQNQGMPNDDNGMASDAMGSGAGSDMMDLDEDEEDDLGSEIDDDGVDNGGMTGGR